MEVGRYVNSICRKQMTKAHDRGSEFFACAWVTLKPMEGSLVSGSSIDRRTSRATQFDSFSCSFGHAKIENTLLYIQVEQAIFGVGDDDEFTVQATNSREEIKQLLSVGLEYICQKDDMLFFRKRK